MRIFLADIGNLIGPLLLVLFAILPRMLGAGKKKQAASRPRPATKPPYVPPPLPRPVSVAPPPPPKPVQEIPEYSELGEVLQELLGRRHAEPEPAPEPEMEPEFVEVAGSAEEPYARDYYKEPAEEPYKLDFQEVPELPWEAYHSLRASELSTAPSSRRLKHHRDLLKGRDSLRDVILLREILGPPRSLQPIEHWEQGGA